MVMAYSMSLQARLSSAKHVRQADCDCLPISSACAYMPDKRRPQLVNSPENLTLWTFLVTICTQKSFTIVLGPNSLEVNRASQWGSWFDEELDDDDVLDSESETSSQSEALLATELDFLALLLDSMCRERMSPESGSKIFFSISMSMLLSSANGASIRSRA